MLLKTRCNDLVPVRESLDHLFHLAVILQILDRQVPCRVLVTDLRILLKKQLDTVYALLDLDSVVDVYMSGQTRVCVLIYLYYCVEKPVDALSAAAHCRYDRHSEQVAQLPDVQIAALGLEFVVHIHRHHHAQVHIYELGGQVEVPLQI